MRLILAALVLPLLAGCVQDVETTPTPDFESFQLTSDQPSALVAIPLSGSHYVGIRFEGDVSQLGVYAFDPQIGRFVLRSDQTTLEVIQFDGSKAKEGLREVLWQIDERDVVLVIAARANGPAVISYRLSQEEPASLSDIASFFGNGTQGWVTPLYTEFDVARVDVLTRNNRIMATYSENVQLNLDADSLSAQIEFASVGEFVVAEVDATADQFVQFDYELAGISTAQSAGVQLAGVDALGFSHAYMQSSIEEFRATANWQFQGLDGRAMFRSVSFGVMPQDFGAAPFSTTVQHNA